MTQTASLIKVEVQGTTETKAYTTDEIVKLLTEAPDMSLNPPFWFLSGDTHNLFPSFQLEAGVERNIVTDSFPSHIITHYLLRQAIGQYPVLGEAIVLYEQISNFCTQEENRVRGAKNPDAILYMHQFNVVRDSVRELFQRAVGSRVNPFSNTVLRRVADIATNGSDDPQYNRLSQIWNSQELTNEERNEFNRMVRYLLQTEGEQLLAPPESESLGFDIPKDMLSIEMWMLRSAGEFRQAKEIPLKDRIDDATRVIQGACKAIDMYRQNQGSVPDYMWSRLRILIIYLYIEQVEQRVRDRIPVIKPEEVVQEFDNLPYLLALHEFGDLFHFMQYRLPNLRHEYDQAKMQEKSTAVTWRKSLKALTSSAAGKRIKALLPASGNSGRGRVNIDIIGDSKEVLKKWISDQKIKVNPEVLEKLEAIADTTAFRGYKRAFFELLLGSDREVVRFIDDEGKDEREFVTRL